MTVNELCDLCKYLQKTGQGDMQLVLEHDSVFYRVGKIKKVIIEDVNDMSGPELLMESSEGETCLLIEGK